MIKKTLVFLNLCVCTLNGAIFHDMDTTRSVYCTFSNKFQNRIMIENGTIQKIVSADEEKLSILMEEFSGQAFIFALDPKQETTTLSVISENGFVQDMQIAFAERSSEVVILNEPEEIVEDVNSGSSTNDYVLNTINQILEGNVPPGYQTSQMQCQKFQLKKDICLELISKFERTNETLYVYQVKNGAKTKLQIFECELQFEGCRWVFLEANTLSPHEQKIAIIAVRND